MAQPVIDLGPLTEQVTNTVGVQASAKTLIDGIITKVQTAIAAAVKADDDADQATVDTVNAAVAQLKTDLAASTAALGEAVAANSDPNAKRK